MEGVPVCCSWDILIITIHWNEGANGGRGDAFVNFAPTKNKDWKLMPGKHYTLRYRVFSYDGEMTRERADRLWNDFAYPPKVTIKK